LGTAQCPQPANTILIIKNKSFWKSARKTFFKTGIKITDQGEHYLGAVIVTKSFREHFIINKVEGWVEDL